MVQVIALLLPNVLSVRLVTEQSSFLAAWELKTFLSTKDRPNRFISLIRENLRLPPAITSSRTLILQAERPLSIKMLFSTAKTLPSQTKQS